MSSADGLGVVASVPTLADGLAVLARMRSTINPDTGRPFDLHSSRADPEHVCAALAIQRGHPSVHKANGRPNYMGAARMYVAPVHANSGELVKGWVRKLEKLDHVTSQAALATDLEQLDLDELGPMIGMPGNSPPDSFTIASPPYTAASDSDAASVVSSLSETSESRKKRLVQALSALNISDDVQARHGLRSSSDYATNYGANLDAYLRYGRGNLDKIAAELARAFRTEQFCTALKAESSSEPHRLLSEMINDLARNHDAIDLFNPELVLFINGISQLSCDQLVARLVSSLRQRGAALDDACRRLSVSHRQVQDLHKAKHMYREFVQIGAGGTASVVGAAISSAVREQSQRDEERDRKSALDRIWRELSEPGPAIWMHTPQNDETAAFVRDSSSTATARDVVLSLLAGRAGRLAALDSALVALGAGAGDWKLEAVSSYSSSKHDVKRAVEVFINQKEAYASNVAARVVQECLKHQVATALGKLGDVSRLKVNRDDARWALLSLGDLSSTEALCRSLLAEAEQRESELIRAGDNTLPRTLFLAFCARSSHRILHPAQLKHSEFRWSSTRQHLLDVQTSATASRNGRPAQLPTRRGLT